MFSPFEYVDPESPSQLVSALVAQRKEGHFCDIAFIVRGTRLTAHHTVLAIGSSYFCQAQFKHSKRPHIIRLRSCTANVFERFLDYMYTGHISLTRESISDLLYFADIFGVSKLKDLCSGYLQDHIAIESLFFVRRLAETFSLSDLLIRCDLFITENADRVLTESTDALKLPMEKAFGLFTQCKPVASMQTLVNFLLRWVSFDLSGRQGYLDYLLANIQLNVTNASYIDSIRPMQLRDLSELYLSMLKQNGASGEIVRTLCQPENIALPSTSSPSPVGEVFLLSASPSAKVVCQQPISGSINDLPRANISQDVQPLCGKTVVGRLPRHKCPECDYSCNSMVRIRQHCHAVHGTKRIFECIVCKYTCDYVRQYYRHMRSHFKGPPFDCERCSHKTKRIRDAILHYSSCSLNEMPFRCTICGVGLRSKAALSAHLTKHDEVLKKNVCSICHRSFRSSGDVRRHLAKHGNERPYKCEECGYTTKYPSDMTSHKRTHSGQLFRCTYEGCTYKATKRSHYEGHLRIHSDSRPFACATCGKNFIERSHLTRHQLTHRTDKPFHCPICPYSSVRRDKLKEHMKRLHKGEPMKELIEAQQTEALSKETLTELDGDEEDRLLTDCPTGMLETTAKDNRAENFSDFCFAPFDIGNGFDLFNWNSTISNHDPLLPQFNFPTLHSPPSSPLSVVASGFGMSDLPSPSFSVCADLQPRPVSLPSMAETLEL
uniref:BTB domain-containing protein n=1 Tax=Trichuris muris TaxID=70415 RepID=A0A5S6R5T5_TRIMR